MMVVALLSLCALAGLGGGFVGVVLGGAASR